MPKVKSFEAPGPDPGDCNNFPQVVVSPLERAYERPSDRKEGEEEDMEGEETPDMETGD